MQALLVGARKPHSEEEHIMPAKMKPAERRKIVSVSIPPPLIVQLDKTLVKLNRGKYDHQSRSSLIVELVTAGLKDATA